MCRARTTVCLAKWLTLYISICCCFKINLVEISLLRVGWVLALNWVCRVSCTISLFNLAHVETETLRSKVFLWWICLCPSKSAYVFWLTFYFFPIPFPDSYTKGTVKELDDHHWHHVCMAWDGNARTIKYFKDGNSIPSDDDCQALDKLKGNPRYLTVGYSRRKLGDEVRLTGFNLWDRVLTNKEVLDNARSCQEVLGNPVAQWNDFYNAAQTNAKEHVVEPSECNIDG